MIPIDTQRWMILAGDRNGECITATHCGIANTVLHMRSLERAGYTTFLMQAEPDTPIPDALLTPNAQPGRNPCCQSDHPGPCYGDPWTCDRCGKTVCCAEGTDDHPELCDDCWAAEFSSFAQQRMQPVTAEGRA